MEFKNPYLDLPSEQIQRTTLEIPFTEVSKLKAYEPRTGVLQTTLSIILKKVINELERAKLEPGDRYGYHAAITNARIVLCDSTGKPLIDDSASGGTVAKPAARSKRTQPKQTVD